MIKWFKRLDDTDKFCIACAIVVTSLLLIAAGV